MWEYAFDAMNIEQIEFPEYLNSMGAEGWEMVHVAGDVMGKNMLGCGEVRIIWKRPVQEIKHD